MNKSELVKKVAENANITQKQAQAAIEAFTGAVTEAMKNDEAVQLLGFGTFKAKARAAREGFNPITKEKIQVPACRVPAFTASKALKDALK